MAKHLSPLLEEVVFVGGQVAELLVTRPEAEQIRPTEDVDVVVAATTRLEYREVEERLVELNLRPDSRDDAPICRWLTPDGLKVDIMPRDEEVLGFGSRWYHAVMEEASTFRLTEHLTIRIPPAPLYLATKWDAFENRGSGDYLKSHDLEDIIAVVAGRSELMGEIDAATEELRQWLAVKARSFLTHPDSDYALHGALADARHISGLVAEVRGHFQEIADRDG